MIQNFQLSNGVAKIDFLMDLDIRNECDQAILYHFQQGMPCEPEVVHAMLKIVHPGDSVVDGGANVGFFTLILSKLVGPTGKVIAVEPGEENLANLKHNIEINSCTNFEVIEKALWSEATRLPMFFYQDGGGNSAWAHEEGDNPTMVQTTTLDTICCTICPKLIKMDIEGAEEEALEGGRHMLRTHFPFVICEVNDEALKKSGASGQTLRAHMFCRGYHAFALPFHGGLPAQIPNNTRIDKHKLNTNIMFTTLQRVGDEWPEIMI